MCRKGEDLNINLTPPGLINTMTRHSKNPGTSLFIENRDDQPSMRAKGYILCKMLQKCTIYIPSIALNLAFSFMNLVRACVPMHPACLDRKMRLGILFRIRLEQATSKLASSELDRPRGGKNPGFSEKKQHTCAEVVSFF